MNGVPNGRKFFGITYTNKDNNEITISSLQISSHNAMKVWNYNTYNNPFDRNRISWSLNIINGNGTVIFKLKNLEYDEDGVFTLEMLEIFKSEKLGINVKVQGKKSI